MSKLADFREKYPQYNDWSDEELAEGLYQKFYSDMPVNDYRQHVGLPPIRPEAPEPSLSERISSKLTDTGLAFFGPNEPESDPSPRLSDQVFAGFDEYRANRALSGAIDQAENILEAEDLETGKLSDSLGIGSTGVDFAKLRREQRMKKALRGDVNAQQQIIQDIQDRRDKAAGDMQELINQHRDLKSRARTVPYSEETQQLLGSETFGDGLEAIGKDPIQVIAEISLRSAPNMAESLALGILGSVAGAPGFAMGMGAGSAAVEYRNTLAEELQANGVDLEDSNSLLDAVENEDLMERVRKKAATRAGIIGSVDAVAGGIATKTLSPMMKKAWAREVTNLVAQTGVQASLGGAGEAAAQYVTEGTIKPGSVLAEAAGELISAPIEVGTATVRGVRAGAVQKLIDRSAQQAEEILNEAKTAQPDTMGEKDPQSQEEVIANDSPMQPVQETSVSIQGQEQDQTRSVLPRVPRESQQGEPEASEGEPNAVVPKLPQEAASNRKQLAELYQEYASQGLELEGFVDVDRATGLGSADHFSNEKDDYSHIVEITAEPMEWIDSKMDADFKTATQLAIGEALAQPNVASYRLSDDSYIIAADSKQEAEASAELAQAILKSQSVESRSGSLQGIDISFDIEAEPGKISAMMEPGNRNSGTVKTPDNAEVSFRNTQPISQMQEGNNYVPYIGNTGDLPIDANHNYRFSDGRVLSIPKMPVRRENIISLISKRLNVPIYQGRGKGPAKALGFYRRGTGEVRTVKHNDQEVVAHEIAHWLDERYPWISRLYKDYLDEMLLVSYDDQKADEGFAEFMRLWMTQEHEAARVAPQFKEAFELELRRDNELYKTLRDSQELMHAWHQQGAKARQASKMGATPASVIHKIQEMVYPDGGFTQAGLDGLRAVKRLERDITGDETLPMYKRMRIAVAGFNSVIDGAFRYGAPSFDPQGNIRLRGKGLAEIFGRWWDNDKLALYMMARRGEELMEQGRENLLREDEILAGLSYAQEHPEFETIFNEYQKFNNRILDFAEEAGLIDAKSREAMKEMNKNYVPFHRVVDAAVNGRASFSGGSPFMRLKGGTQNVKPLFENIVNSTGTIIRSALINAAKREMYATIMGSKNQAGARYAAPAAEKLQFQDQKQREMVVGAVLKSLGLTRAQYKKMRAGPANAQEAAQVEMIEHISENIPEIVQIFKQKVDPTGNVDYFLNDGKKVWFELMDPGLIETINFLGPKPMNLAYQIFSMASGALRRGTTSFPAFQVLNFVRDAASSWSQTPQLTFPGARAAKTLVSSLDQNPTYQEWIANGGGFSNRLDGFHAQRSLLVNPSTWLARYDRALGRVENSNRFAVYEAMRKKGVPIRDAIIASRDNSTDFGMRGSHDITRFLTLAVPFLNARAQSHYRIGRMIREKDHQNRRTAIQTYALKGSAMMLASVALMMVNSDDERYQRLPKNVRHLNWVFFWGPGDSDYVLIPKPFETGMLFGSVPEEAFNLTREEGDTDEFYQALKWMLLEVFNYDMEPQLFTPELELQRNKNWAGSPIIPPSLEGVEPSEQWTSYTSEAVKAVGRKYNVSPLVIEHRLRGYLGRLGNYLLQVSDATYRWMTDMELENQKPTSGETWRTSPMTKFFLGNQLNEGPTRRSRYDEEFWDMAKEADKVAQTVSRLQKLNDDYVYEYLHDLNHEELLETNEILSSAKQALSDLRIEKGQVIRDSNLTGDQKRLELWRIRREEISITEGVVLQIQAEQRKNQDDIQRRFDDASREAAANK